MAKQRPRKTEYKFSFLQLGVIAGFCLGCMLVSYWLGVYTGTRAGYETAISSDMAASAKIPIDLPAIKEERRASVSDVYAKLDENSSVGLASTPLPKETGAAELAAIQKVELPQVKPQTKYTDDIDAEIADTLINPLEEDGASKTVHSQKSASEEIWSANAGQASASAKGDSTNTLSAVKKHEDQKDLKFNQQQMLLKEQKKETQGQELAGKELQAIPPSATKGKEPEKAALQDIIKPSPTVSKKDLENGKGKEKEKIKDQDKEREKELKGKALEEDALAARKAVPRGWFAQVAAPKELQDANGIASKLRKSGFPVVIETARVRGENYYRVLVGPETNQETANRLLGQLKREPYLQGEPFVKMVK